ncbi:MAG: copper chaperone [Chloroflexi bacterium]|nr:MAG: copper chaperone [Chloroflexota bacterium]MBL1197205.1 copper chaperone [Chloroflexota bacterium]NOH14499.1 heavy-metal-associated domain-containing protein [Chloroflexota bacterium]
MKKLTLQLPKMYADHHVVEVRRLLEEMPGVKAIYASSAFHQAQIEYDGRQVKEEDLTAKLEEAGYMGEMPMDVEREAHQEDTPFFRKTAVIEQVGSSVSFAQEVNGQGRPLWPCPGVGTLTEIEKEMEEVG